MIEIAGLVVAGVTALGALVQAYNSAKAANTEVSESSLKKAEARANSPLKRGAKRVAEVIDADLLETLQANIETHNKRLIDAFRSAEVSDSEREKMVEDARLQICSLLNQIMRFNEGNLPTRRLENLWASNRCEK